MYDIYICMHSYGDWRCMQYAYKVNIEKNSPTSRKYVQNLTLKFISIRFPFLHLIFLEDPKHIGDMRLMMRDLGPKKKKRRN